MSVSQPYAAFIRKALPSAPCHRNAFVGKFLYGPTWSPPREARGGRGKRRATRPGGRKTQLAGTYRAQCFTRAVREPVVFFNWKTTNVCHWPLNTPNTDG